MIRCLKLALSVGLLGMMFLGDIAQACPGRARGLFGGKIVSRVRHVEQTRTRGLFGRMLPVGMQARYVVQPCSPAVIPVPAPVPPIK